MTTRESIYTALYDLLTPLLAPGAVTGTLPTGSSTMDGIARPGRPTTAKPFNYISREVIEVTRVPPELQPVLFMDEAFEHFNHSGDGLTTSNFQVWFHIGVLTPIGTAAPTVLNPLIDTLITTLGPDPVTGVQNLGLGDVVEDAYFNGLAVKNFGENSLRPNHRQGVAYIPFEINSV